MDEEKLNNKPGEKDESHESVKLDEEVMIRGEITPFSKLLGKAFEAYKGRFKKFMTLAMIGFFGMLPMMIVMSIAAVTGVWEEGATNVALSATLGILAFLTFLFGIYVSVCAQAGIIIMIESPEEEPVKETFRKARKIFWSYLGLSLLVGIFVMLWSLLLIIPGIIMAVFYTFATYVLVFEKKRAMSSIKRSKELVKNYWWPVFGRLVLLGLIYLVIGLIFGIPSGFMEETSIAYNIWNIVQQFISFIIGPIFAIYVYLIYKKLVAIKGSGETKNV